MPLYGSMVTSPKPVRQHDEARGRGNGDEYVGELYYDKRTPVPWTSERHPTNPRCAQGSGRAGGASAGRAVLRGPGDGMSDDIPATVHDNWRRHPRGGQRVRGSGRRGLSPLGNGSSDAGAKVLEEMGRRVRHARTGNPQQGRKINPRSSCRDEAAPLHRR